MQESAIDGTKKYLFKLADNNMVESVWMKYKHGNSVCYFLPGGLQDGLPVLCLYSGRLGGIATAFRNAGSDLCHFQC